MNPFIKWVDAYGVFDCELEFRQRQVMVSRRPYTRHQSTLSLSSINGIEI